MEDYIDRSNFLNRVQALQRMCSDSDPNFPNALLFVPGQDGRGNKGSITVLKYLLTGSVSKELYDETLDAVYEPVEDVILLVKQSSVSVVWSHEMKRLMMPLFSLIPMLIEYLSTTKEEMEIDLIQARKCCDFKRMMLDSVKEKGGLGIPIPIGYDDVQDVESWPIFQAFALDSVYCATGFFTARYNIADITSHLDILFRTVDGYYVDRAIDTMGRTVGPHVAQSLVMLDASTAEQRSRVTADDVVGPLEILYDFGEMEAIGAVDAATKPVVLFGTDTSLIGTATAGPYPAHWRDATAGRSLHAVIEGCEPSTGLRWCRSYFLQRGRVAASVAHDDPDDDGPDDLSPHSSKGGGAAAGMVSIAAVQSLQRLEGLYVKLMICLRHVAKQAFSTHTDVLEAGQEVQRKMDYLMKNCCSSTTAGKNESKREEGKGVDDADTADLIESMQLLQLEQWQAVGLGDSSLVLQGAEVLQVHMDCVNAVGEVVTIEDVDDMGGSCWTYIRVAVHGIAVPAYDNKNNLTSSVAVGDTFLFSSHRVHCGSLLPVAAADNNSNNNNNSRSSSRSSSSGMPQQFSPFLLQSDGCCITHPVPYYRCLIAAGPEEVSTLRLLSSTRSTHMLANLGLGRHLDLTGTGLLTASVLSDHPLIPHFEAELRTFAEGFVVEKMDGATCLPMLISFGAHVDRVWSVDTTEFLEQALKLQSGAVLADPHLPPVEVQSGMMMIFRLKCGDDVMADEADGQSLNPLERSMPFTTRTKSKQEQQGIQGIKYIAIVVRTGMRSAAAIGAAFAEWRVGMRLNDVHEHRGVGDVTLPRSLLRAYLSLLDYWAEGISNMMTGLSHNSNETFTAAAAVASTGVLPEPPQKQQNQQRGRDHGRFITGHSLVAAATSYRKLVTTAVSFAHFPMLQIPGAGFYAMRCVHTLSDAQRLSLFLSSQSTDMILAEEDAAAAATTTATTTAATTSTTVGEGKLMLLVGHAGSGITCVSRNLLQQWSERMTSSESFTNVFIDFGVLQVTSKDPDTPADKGQLDRFIDRCCAAATGSPPLSGNHTIARCDFVVVTAVLSPTQHIPVNMLMNLLSRKFGMPPSAVITVLVPVQLALSDEAEYGSDDAPAADEPYIFAHRLLKDSGYGLGGEYWRSMGIDALASGCCDIALAVDDLADTTTTISSSNSGGGGASASSSGTGKSDGALAYRAFRGYLSVINPSAQIDRLTPMNLRLDTETLELILNTIELQNTTPLLLSSSSSSSSSASGSREGSLLTERQSYAIARGFPALSSLQSLTSEATYLHNFATQRPLNASSSVGDAICVGVTAVRISPAALGVESWNFSHVLRVLQLLFPQAKVSAASIDDTTWKVPPKPTSATTGSSRQQSHFERLIQLARAKALCSKQNEEGRRWFQQRLNELLPSSTTHSAAAAVTKNGSPSPGSSMNTLVLDRLIRGIRSVHGTISLPTGIKAVHTPAEVHASASVSVPVATSALLEAGSAFVIVRPAASALAIEEKLGDDLIVQGIFGVQEETLLKDLFKMCAQYKLNPKPLLTVDRVSERDRHAVQRNAKYSNKFELPGGWWYDGQSYINLNGDRKQLRPDIEQLLNLYIEDENTKIAEYNSLLSDLH